MQNDKLIRSKRSNIQRAANSFDWLLSCDWFALFKLNLQIIRNWVRHYFFKIKRNEWEPIHSKKVFFPDIKVKGLFLKAKSLDKIQIRNAFLYFSKRTY